MKNSKRSKQKSQSAKPKFSLTPEEQKPLEDLLKDHGVKNWDFLIVGDGSGSNWNREAGWGAVSIEKITMERLVWTGTMNKGTVNFAEMMAYQQPLSWLAAREEDRRAKRAVKYRAYQVHIFTDSDYCRQTGNSKNRLVAKNGALWAAFDSYVRQGFVLNWHWIPRGSVALNSYCDRLSKLARLLMKKYNLQEKLETEHSCGGVPRTVYDINPSEAG